MAAVQYAETTLNDVFEAQQPLETGTEGISEKVEEACPNFLDYSQAKHSPFSGGPLKLPSQRPTKRCRTFEVAKVDETLTKIAERIADADLRRLFENAWPNTLDTAIRWHGSAARDSSEELTFLITGDIDALWLRDSSNQLQSYVDLLTASDSRHSLASLFRGLINLQSRYILANPFCNAFNPPVEAKLQPSFENAKDNVFPACDPQIVFECKYELDSLAAFLQVSSDYYAKTQDAAFFRRYEWLKTVRTIIQTARSMQVGTFQDKPAYTFSRQSDSATETQANQGRGHPVAGHTGLVRSFFRPSDDSTLYQLFIPANIMFSHYLHETSKIFGALATQEGSKVQKEMLDFAKEISLAVEKHGIIQDDGEKYYAYEVDGYGGVNMMDDANIPSLLSLPLFGIDSNNEIYQNTRRRVLSLRNPYFFSGPVISGIGGPHVSFDFAWPMSLIVRGLTSTEEEEIRQVLKSVLNSTADLGLIHESVHTHDPSRWTRPWFSWANGLFGQLVYKVHNERPHLLQEIYSM